MNIAYGTRRQEKLHPFDLDESLIINHGAVPPMCLKMSFKDIGVPILVRTADSLTTGLIADSTDPNDVSITVGATGSLTKVSRDRTWYNGFFQAMSPI